MNESWEELRHEISTCRIGQGRLGAAPASVHTAPMDTEDGGAFSRNIVYRIGDREGCPGMSKVFNKTYTLTDKHLSSAQAPVVDHRRRDGCPAASKRGPGVRTRAGRCGVRSRRSGAR
jgi:hypothetical protein